MAHCIVSHVDHEGLRHTVEVEADSLYEAAALAIRTFRAHHCEPTHASNLEVEVRTSVVHTLSPKKLHDWLERGMNSPRDVARKERVLAGLFLHHV